MIPSPIETMSPQVLPGPSGVPEAEYAETPNNRLTVDMLADKTCPIMFDLLLSYDTIHHFPSAQGKLYLSDDATIGLCSQRWDNRRMYKCPLSRVDVDAIVCDTYELESNGKITKVISYINFADTPAGRLDVNVADTPRSHLDVNVVNTPRSRLLACLEDFEVSYQTSLVYMFLDAINIPIQFHPSIAACRFTIYIADRTEMHAFTCAVFKVGTVAIKALMFVVASIYAAEAGLVAVIALVCFQAIDLNYLNDIAESLGVMFIANVIPILILPDLDFPELLEGYMLASTYLPHVAVAYGVYNVGVALIEAVRNY